MASARVRSLPGLKGWSRNTEGRKFAACYSAIASQLDVFLAFPGIPPVRLSALKVGIEKDDELTSSINQPDA